MYLPPAFNVRDPEKVARFIEQYSFATVVSLAGMTPFASHLPLLWEGESSRLVGHMARANPQWRHFGEGREVLAVFHGPHAYVSPRWYETTPAVPTWNYAVVHAYGRARVVTDEIWLADVVRRTVRFYEREGPGAWGDDLPDDFRRRMMRAVVGFEIAITRIEAKFKLGQNRSRADVAGVHAALARSLGAGERALAELMSREALP